MFDKFITHVTKVLVQGFEKSAYRRNKPKKETREESNNKDRHLSSKETNCIVRTHYLMVILNSLPTLLLRKGGRRCICLCKHNWVIFM